MIDEALEELSPPDREVILVRFFEGRPFAEMGAALDVSADAARMRVERALEKLRTGSERRGIESVSAALAMTLATQSSLAVPAGVAATVSGAALSAGATAGAATLFTFMSATKISVGLLGVMAIGATAIAVREHRRAHVAETGLATLMQQMGQLQSELAQAETQRVVAERRAAESEKDPDGVVAVLGDRTITVQDVRRQIAPAMAKLRETAREPDELDHLL